MAKIPNIKRNRFHLVHNKKLSIYKICHSDWCEPGETSIIAHVLTSEDEDHDRETGQLIVDALNSYKKDLQNGNPPAA